MIIIIHSKHFAVFDWLQSHSNSSKPKWCLPYLKDVSNIPLIWWYTWLETRLINGIFDWKWGYMDNRQSINRLKRTCVYILKLCPKIGRSLKGSLQGGKLVKNLKIFWMNNKTIIEFGFQTLIMNYYIQNSKETVYSRLHYLFQQVCNKESENWSVFYTLFKKTR